MPWGPAMPWGPVWVVDRTLPVAGGLPRGPLVQGAPNPAAGPEQEDKGKCQEPEQELEEVLPDLVTEQEHNDHEQYHGPDQDPELDLGREVAVDPQVDNGPQHHQDHDNSDNSVQERAVAVVVVIDSPGCGTRH